MVLTQIYCRIALLSTSRRTIYAVSATVTPGPCQKPSCASLALPSSIRPRNGYQKQPFLLIQPSSTRTIPLPPPLDSMSNTPRSETCACRSSFFLPGVSAGLKLRNTGIIPVLSQGQRSLHYILILTRKQPISRSYSDKINAEHIGSRPVDAALHSSSSKSARGAHWPKSTIGPFSSILTRRS